MQERYGSFYADFKEDGFPAYFYFVCHAFENIFCAIIEASMQDDTYGMYIATGGLTVVYMIIICAARPFAESEKFWFLQGVNTVVLYSVVVAYVSDMLHEKADGLSESDVLGLKVSSVVTLVLMVVFTTWSSIPLFEFAKETLWVAKGMLWDPLRGLLRSRDDGLPADPKGNLKWQLVEIDGDSGAYVWL